MLPPPTRRSPRSVLPVLVAAVVLVLAAVVPSAAPAATSSPSPAAPAPPTGSARDYPDRGEDFARLPERCYDAADLATSPCRVTRFGRHRPFLFLWGDSHALMYLRPVRDLARLHRVNLVVMVFGSCPVSVPVDDGRLSGCEQFNVAAYSRIRGAVRADRRVRVVIGGYWARYRRNYVLLQREAQTGEPSGVDSFHAAMARLAVERSGGVMRALAGLGVRTDFIAQAAVPAAAPPCEAGEDPYACDLPRSRALPAEDANSRFLARLAKPFPVAPLVIDPVARYCDGTTCRAQVGGVPTWYDELHLGDRLAALTERWFRPSFRRLAPLP